MDVHNFLRSRRSVRHFKPDPIPDSVIERILTTATYAPSAHNLQPWRFVIIKNQAVRSELARALTTKMRLDMQAEGAPKADLEKRMANSLRRIDEAPVIILLCRDVTAVRVDTPEETVMNIQSTALVALQLLLAAHAEGLGGNWICWPLYATQETQTTLGLSKSWEPQAMIFVGYAIDVIKNKNLKPITELMKII
jgi:coenzyme F420-0:L-glutamate ligase/coenzyme F420-1:gamma-L-glutamate ligase